MEPIRADEGQPARLPVGVQDVADSDQVFGGSPRPDLGRHRVVQPREEMQVGTVELAGPLTAPNEVSRSVVPAARERVPTGHGLLVAEDQGLVARVEVDLVQALL